MFHCTRKHIEFAETGLWGQISMKFDQIFPLQNPRDRIKSLASVWYYHGNKGFFYPSKFLSCFYKLPLSMKLNPGTVLEPRQMEFGDRFDRLAHGGPDIRTTFRTMFPWELRVCVCWEL